MALITKSKRLLATMTAVLPIVCTLHCYGNERSGLDIYGLPTSIGIISDELYQPQQHTVPTPSPSPVAYGQRRGQMLQSLNKYNPTAIVIEKPSTITSTFEIESTFSAKLAGTHKFNVVDISMKEEILSVMRDCFTGVISDCGDGPSIAMPDILIVVSQMEQDGRSISIPVPLDGPIYGTNVDTSNASVVMSMTVIDVHTGITINTQNFVGKKRNVKFGLGSGINIENQLKKAANDAITQAVDYFSTNVNSIKNRVDALSSFGRVVAVEGPYVYLDAAMMPANYGATFKIIGERPIANSTGTTVYTEQIVKAEVEAVSYPQNGVLKCRITQSYQRVNENDHASLTKLPDDVLILLADLTH